MRFFFFFIRILLSLTLATVLVSCASTPRPTAEVRAQSSPADPIASLLPSEQSPPEHTEPSPTRLPSPPAAAKPLERMGFSTQVGAFSNLENAVRLEHALDARGIDAYYFRHESGLYKVRFGNHPSYRQARREAESLRDQGLIDRFFIVIPEEYAAAKIKKSGQGSLRNELVRTARRFLGVPYRWGGEDRRRGFDCSGLTMVCYRLNGLNLPRNSRMQFRAGKSVGRNRLHKGDLVFFATHGGQRVTHVGMYAGNGKFIHAPRTGKTVRFANLSSSYWRKAYVGARSYL